MDHQIISEGNKRLSIHFKTSANLTPIEKHKIEEAIKQFLLKSDKNITKLKNRGKRIFKENE